MTAPYTSRLLNRFSALAVLAVTFIVLVYHFPIPPHIKSTSKAPESPKKISIPQTATPAYSIKPLVYIFPQYYPFPENDKIWGANFTEWDNVRKATHNVFGLETIRPHESVGYYNGLSLQTRQRQGQFIRDHGIYGAVFHHYWFAGKPVMDHVVQALLKDGEPNIPFMLSWANEPWTARWDGLDQGKIFIAQAYGTAADWKAHFDFLLPFFLHPNYIRSEGRVQFAVYKAEHMHNVGPRMFAAWRVWAKEAGFEMDIIETRWAWEKWNDGIPDAVNEFQPHVSGFDHARHPHSRRINRVYHRGTLVCWDSTPRHVTDGGGHPCPTCHPSTWQTYMVEMFKRIKEDPNPLGAENFLFINALNEWGEGNALEPSVQFGYGYGEAMLNAISISEKEHSWPDTTLKVGIERQATIKVAPTDQPDICVVAQVSPDHTNVHTFKLEALLASLQNQHNKAWRLVLFQSNDRAFGELDHIVYKFMDPRMSVVRITPELRQAYTDDDAGALGTDWIIRNLNASKSGCDNAKYVLITDGGNTYEPTAFAVTYSAATPDKMLQMNVESRHTLWDHEELQNRKWDDYCVGIMRVSFSSICVCPRGPTTFAPCFLFSLNKYPTNQPTFFCHSPTSHRARATKDCLRRSISRRL